METRSEEARNSFLWVPEEPWLTTVTAGQLTKKLTLQPHHSPQGRRHPLGCLRRQRAGLVLPGPWVGGTHVPACWDSSLPAARRISTPTVPAGLDTDPEHSQTQEDQAWNPRGMPWQCGLPHSPRPVPGRIWLFWLFDRGKPCPTPRDCPRKETSRASTSCFHQMSLSRNMIHNIPRVSTIVWLRVPNNHPPQPLGFQVMRPGRPWDPAGSSTGKASVCDITACSGEVTQ